VSGLLAGANCPDPRDISYDLSSGSRPPTRVCDVHGRGAGRRERSRAAASRARRDAEGAGKQVSFEVCAITGKLATPYCPIVVRRTFAAGEAPTETCPRHGRR